MHFWNRIDQYYRTFAIKRTGHFTMDVAYCCKYSLSSGSRIEFHQSFLSIMGQAVDNHHGDIGRVGL